MKNIQKILGQIKGMVLLYIAYSLTMRQFWTLWGFWLDLPWLLDFGKSIELVAVVTDVSAADAPVLKLLRLSFRNLAVFFP